MSPPVAAPHCGICCRPFRLHTWTRRAFPRVSSLCATRRLGAVNRRGVCSESGGGKPGLSKGIFFDTTWQWTRLPLLLLLDVFCFGAVCRESVKQVSESEQQMFLVDMRPEWKQQRGTGGPSSGSAAVESGWSPSFGSHRSSRHQVRP